MARMEEQYDKLPYKTIGLYYTGYIIITMSEQGLLSIYERVLALEESNAVLKHKVKNLQYIVDTYVLKKVDQDEDENIDG